MNHLPTTALYFTMQKQNITTTRTITDFTLIIITMIIITMPLYLTKNHTYIYLGWESCLGLFPGMIRQLRSRLSLSVWLSTWEATAVLPYMAGRGCISCPTLFPPPPPDYSPVRATARAPVQGGMQFRASLHDCDVKYSMEKTGGSISTD